MVGLLVANGNLLHVRREFKLKHQIKVKDA